LATTCARKARSTHARCALGPMALLRVVAASLIVAAPDRRAVSVATSLE